MIETDESGRLAVLPFTREDIEQTVPARLEKVARRFPDHDALIGNGQRWTYQELNRRVNRLAHAIRTRTRPGPGCVAFLTPHSPEMVVAALAVLKAGKAYLALHPELPAAAQRAIVHDAGPELLLTIPDLDTRARDIAAGSAAVLSLDEIDGQHAEANPRCAAGPHDPAAIFYTSGTTGQSKGVVKSHRSLLHRVWLVGQHDAVTPADRQSLLTSCSFASSEADLFGSLLHGAALCLFDLARQGLAAFREWLERERITLLHPPVLLFRRFLSTLEGESLFPSVRQVALAGDVVLPTDVAKWRRHFASTCSLQHRFSTTETALLAVVRIGSAEGPCECARALSPLLPASEGNVLSGRPVADKLLELVDEEGRPVAEGQTGQLLVTSSYLSDGYWRRPDETAAVFKQDPDHPGQRTYRTGDLGRFLSDGRFVFEGRGDHQVKIRGYRVDTREVDAALLQLNEVAEAVTLVQRSDGEPWLAAFVVLKAGFPFEPSTLRERVRVLLPEWKTPACFLSLPSLPTTLTGKVDRQHLAEVLGASDSSETSGSDGPAALEDELAEIWRSALRLEAVGPDAPFLDLGGDSLSAMMVLNRIEQRHGVRLTPAEFLQHRTIRQLAEYLRARILATEAEPYHEPEAPLEEGVTLPAPRAAVIDNVADGYVELLNVCGVDRVFINPGTDTAPILESIAKFKARGHRTPELVLCLHESVAMAAAHGSFMVSGRPQVVLVHVDVGTQNIGGNLHNAQRGRAGVIICAGRAPYTVDGSRAGGRNRASHWIQEQFSQASIVQGYVKWQYELTCRENLQLAVQRAFQVAGTEPTGPVYLMLPREVLVERLDTPIIEPRHAPVVAAPAADPESLARAAQWLIEADRPLILVAHAGRNPEAVALLVGLAETLAAPVVESRQRVNFPSSHPLHVGFSAAGYLQQADCVLILDHDVPWVPAQGRPSPDCRIIHIDTDPLKRDIPIWGFPVDLAMQADSAKALEALAEEIERQLSPAARERFEARRRVVSAEHQAQRARLRQRALDRAADQPIAPEWAAHCLNELVVDDTLIVSEVVTNTPVLWNHLCLDMPGSYYQSLGSSLGWGLGAALGAKLVAPSRTVICTVGDGAWVLGSPLAVYWAAEQHHCPFLTVIFNNQEYFATTEAILTAAPEGYARRTGHYPGCDLPRPPLYSRVAEAMGLWARTVTEPATLPSILREALDEVRRGRSALVDICVSSPRSRLGMAPVTGEAGGDP